MDTKKRGRPTLDSPQKKQKRKKKDPNRPKRAQCAYFYYLSHLREHNKKHGIEFKKVGDFTKDASAKWKSLTDDEKKPFDKAAADDKERFDEEMRSYKPAKDTSKPKRPLSSYFVFLADFREKCKGKDMANKEILQQAGATWGCLHQNEKKVYEEKAAELKCQHEKEMAEYHKKKAAGGGSGDAGNGTTGHDDGEDEEEETEDSEESD